MGRTFFILIVFVVPVVLFGNAQAAINDGLVAYYPFNNNANDESGNQNDGDVNGPVLSRDRLGNYNSAYRFDGESDFILVDDDSTIDIPGPNFSISAWIQVNSFGSTQVIVRKALEPNLEYMLAITSEGMLYFDGEAGSNWGTVSDNSITLGEWHHVAGVRNNGQVLLYIDGSLNKTSTTSLGTRATTGPMTIGINYDEYLNNTQSTWDFNGLIDEVRIYNRALSISEIEELGDEVDGTSDHDQVTITSGTLNSANLSTSAPQITVDPGETISGTVRINVHNTHDSNAIFPVGYAYSWASDNASGYSSIDSWASTGDSSYTVNITETAPDTPGTYYLAFAASSTYSLSNLMASNCGYSSPTSSDWNNGNDIADQGESSYSLSNSQHWITIVADGGCDHEPGLAMIRVVVSDASSDTDHDQVTITSGTLNSETLSISAPQVTVAPDEIISGIVDINVHNTHDSNAIFPVGYAYGWAWDNASGYRSIDSWASAGDSSYSVNINETAPSTPGTYYLYFAASATYGLDNLFASKCGSASPTSSDWNNGNDIADQGATAYATSKSQHWISIAADGGCNHEPGLLMIKVVVSGSTDSGSDNSDNNDSDSASDDNGGGGGCFIKSIVGQ